MNTRTFALVLGIVYSLIGVLGFIPGFLTPPHSGAPSLAVASNYGYLLGLFPVNILHNIVHLGIGLWGIMAYKDFYASRIFARGVCIIFGIVTIMGIIPGLKTAFGLMPIFGHDVWLHALTAILGGYFGFMMPSHIENDMSRHNVHPGHPGRA